MTNPMILAKSPDGRIGVVFGDDRVAVTRSYDVVETIVSDELNRMARHATDKLAQLGRALTDDELRAFVYAHDEIFASFSVGDTFGFVRVVRPLAGESAFVRVAVLPCATKESALNFAEWAVTLPPPN